jgi:hypothetical protein
MLVAVLILLNLPLFLFIGWLAFDTASGASQTFFETTVAVLKIILIPWIVRRALGMDDYNAVGILPIAGFFIACGMILFGEIRLLKWLGWIESPPSAEAVALLLRLSGVVYS